MLLKIVFSFLSVTLLGGLLGVGLAVAAKLLAVKKDERIGEVESILPGANCGACGYPGCSGYAEAVVNEGASLTLCSPGGAEVAEKIAKIMGQSVEVSATKMVAQVHCRGTRDTSKYAFDYNGLADCNAMMILYGGDKECKYGCLQGGSCIAVCPVDAIGRDEKNRIWVDKDRCISCGKCIDVCPTNVMKWVPYDADYIVACNSKDKGAKTRKYCTVGCIACKICEKKSGDGGFIVEDFLAHIEYDMKGDRTAAVESCPAKCIISTKTAKAEIDEVKETVKVNDES